MFTKVRIRDCEQHSLKLQMFCVKAVFTVEAALIRLIYRAVPTIYFIIIVSNIYFPDTPVVGKLTADAKFTHRLDLRRNLINLSVAFLYVYKWSGRAVDVVCDY
jgi:hypothetical protein